MKVEIKIPSLKKRYEEAFKKYVDNDPQRALFDGLMVWAGARISGIPKRCNSDSFDRAVGGIYQAGKDRDYSDVNDLVDDIEQYWEFLESLAEDLARVARSEGYVVCEKCGEIEKPTTDDGGLYMPCCGYTEQSEIKKQLETLYPEVEE